MANPAPPAASYAAMHTRAGYADGAVLTTAELDAACALLLAQDGNGNVAEVISQYVGAYGQLCKDATDSVWLVRNAYFDVGTASWYPFVESTPSVGICLKNVAGPISTITFNWAAAKGGDGAITWTTVATFGQFGSIPWSTAINLVTATGNTSITPSMPINAYRDTAALGADKTCTVHVANAYDGMEVEFARSGSSGGHNRTLLQDDGVTTIKAVADNFTAKLRYSSAAVLWYLTGYYACS